ncbi:ubiquitin-like-conjugating enzyme ATG10 [Engraulis encrasicolus]|uniref:ubiquitin-like-conjugating enzyme ATG10 n=1 Tax=Engraulis encrasicolus TaxID=184585 RepID=UPI002FD666D8
MAADTSLPATSCYLDEEAFRRSCELFLEHSHSLGDGWAWEKFCGSETEGFMHKTVMVPYRVSSLPCQRAPGDDADALMEEEQLSDQDEAARELTAEAEGQAAVRYEYHVVYSCSYQIPILYFRASTLEGRSLSLEEVWNNVHPNYQQRLRQGPWDTITQQEHPLLGQPFFMLHPCKTEEFMRPALETARAEKKGVNYIVTWLSVVGPVVGLDVPLSYGLAVPPAPETAVTTVTTTSASASASAVVAEASSSTSASTSICAAEKTD